MCWGTRAGGLGDVRERTCSASLKKESMAGATSSMPLKGMRRRSEEMGHELAAVVVGHLTGRESDGSLQEEEEEEEEAACGRKSSRGRRG